MGAPISTTHQVITIAERGDTTITHRIATVATHQRIRARHRATYTRSATAPGHRAFVAAPSNTTHHIIAIAEQRDALLAHMITIAATNQRVAARYHAANTRCATAPRHRAFVAAPTDTTHHIIAVSQRSNAIPANSIICRAANQRVATRYRAANARCATAPGHRAFGAVPVLTTHHVIAIGKSSDAAIAHQIPIVTTTQGAD